MLAHEHLAEAEALHDPVEDESATADHIHASRMHDRYRGALSAGLGQQAPGYFMHLGRGHAQWWMRAAS